MLEQGNFRLRNSDGRGFIRRPIWCSPKVITPRSGSESETGSMQRERVVMSNCRNAFTLIEVLIVVIIMAVLAATIIPQFTESTKDAKDSSLKFNVHTMRSQIEMYKMHHLGNYPSFASFVDQMTKATDASGTVDPSGAYGPYITGGKLPNNPYNDLDTVVAGTGAAGDGSSGWQYDETTGGIWPNHTGWTP